MNRFLRFFDALKTGTIVGWTVLMTALFLLIWLFLPLLGLWVIISSTWKGIRKGWRGDP